MTQVSRRLARAALVASTALALGAPAIAAPGKGGHPMCHPGMSRLSVTGQGEARVAPDMATIQLGVTTQAPTAAEAMRQNSTQQTAVLEALTAAGIEAADVQTSGLNLNPVMDYGEGRAPTVTGYQASNMVAVRVKDVPRLGEVLDAIVGAGANEINGISFIRDDSAASEDEARRAAVEDARHKAEILAEAAGLSLGPVLVLRDAAAPDGPRPMMMEARGAADAAKVPVAAGELALTAQVEMQFALTGQDCGKTGHGPGHMGGQKDGQMGGQMGGHMHDHMRMHGGHGMMHGGAGGPGPQGEPGQGLPEGHPPVPAPAPGDGAATPAPADDAEAPGQGVDSAAPAPADGADAPVPGDVPPPMGTDTGAPAADEPVVPMGEAPAGDQPPAN